jgi:hypothetical protein
MEFKRFSYVPGPVNRCHFYSHWSGRNDLLLLCPSWKSYHVIKEQLQCWINGVFWWTCSWAFQIGKWLFMNLKICMWLSSSYDSSDRLVYHLKKTCIQLNFWNPNYIKIMCTNSVPTPPPKKKTKQRVCFTEIGRLMFFEEISCLFLWITGNHLQAKYRITNVVDVSLCFEVLKSFFWVVQSTGPDSARIFHDSPLLSPLMLILK